MKPAAPVTTTVLLTAYSHPRLLQVRHTASCGLTVTMEWHVLRLWLPRLHRRPDAVIVGAGEHGPSGFDDLHPFRLVAEDHTRNARK